jgi:hypothetical protein
LSEVTVITASPHEGVTLDNETGTEIAAVEAVEATTEAAVEIAQIQADATVAVAETHAAVEIARIEANAETHDEIAALRERNSWLENELMNMQERDREREALILPILPTEETALETETIIEEELDPETLTTDIVETLPETLSETQTEALEENVEEKLEVAQVAVKRRLRLL